MAEIKRHFERTQLPGLHQLNQDRICTLCDEIDFISSSLLDERNSLIGNMLDALYHLKIFVRSELMQIADTPALLLSGEAGMGKSHLLADVAVQRKKSGKASILLLGQHFTSESSPWGQILSDQLRLKCSENEFLGALNSKAEASGERIFFMVDAMNEGKGRYFWQDYLPGFINKFSHYPWIALVLSVRSSYEHLISPPDLIGASPICRIVHQGFAENEFDATSIFFGQFGIEMPDAPFLHPEFRNPLFLKMFCEGLKLSNLSQVPKGYSGITAITNYFLNSVNRKLSQPKEFDYPENVNLVQEVIRRIVEINLKMESSAVPYEDAFVLAEAAISPYSNRRRFLDALISEGVFSKTIIDQKFFSIDEVVYVTYERFEDHLTSAYLLDKYVIDGEIAGTFIGLDKLGQYLGENFHRQGLLEAIAIQLPERTGKELYEVLTGKKTIFWQTRAAFVHGLLWRRYDTIDDRVEEYVKNVLLPDAEGYDLFFQLVYSVCSDPNHRFNADWLHGYLMPKSLANRDAEWTTYLHDKTYESSPIQRLLDWASVDDSRSYLSKESRLLACTAISWTFTSTNIGFRDAASKSLACLLRENIPIALSLLKKFHQVNDPYVYERILCATYGAVLLSTQTEKIGEVCDFLVKDIFLKEEVYPNVMVRDYARNIVEFALYMNRYQLLDVEVIRPPYKSTFPTSLPTIEQIDKFKFEYGSAEFKDSYWGQNDIINSMTTEYGRGIGGYGDFGRYTFQSALHDWEDFDPQLLSNYACSLIFQKYGYDVNLHGLFDRHATSGDRHRNKIERIGKKYQWLALYEVIARISDNHRMVDESNRWNENKILKWFEGPWSPFIRNIDPTVIFSPKELEKRAIDRWWDAGSQYFNWSGSHDEWLVSTDALPDPVALISLVDGNGERWIALERNVGWDEPIPIGYDKYDYPHKHLWHQVGFPHQHGHIR